MKTKRSLWLPAAMVFAASLANAGGLTYTCNGNVDQTEAGTCAYLNNTIASLYNNTFTNLNADVYIQMGITGLGAGEAPNNSISYSAYVGALTANSVASGNPVQIAAVAALAANDNSVYGNGSVEITSALGSALGLSGLTGFYTNGDYCMLGVDANCYNDILTITTPANLSSETDGSQVLWWRQEGGSIPANTYNGITVIAYYDFYSIVEHETDEALGTASCIETQTQPLASNCDYGGPNFGAPGSNTPSAVDLFRYSGVGGTLVPDSALSTTSGAIFSYDGGLTNGANGAVYNTLNNGEDYADYASNCKFVQDATGCLGQSLDITTDGGEINILNAVGYDVVSTPEPGTIALVGIGLLAVGVHRRRRRA